MTVRILVVDDESDIEMLFKQQFRRELREGRFVLDFAGSGDEALAKMKANGAGSLILLVSDINMPGMSGLDLLVRIKEERPDLPVLMITAYGDASTRKVALERGADGLLTKPLDFSALRAEIQARVAGGAAGAVGP
ncbi:MAG TPA: response regulator [Beijerinckiaceae bacterium]|jgi:CheY-like chemotaxis protein|nr:response regulator [Beijerinckiaceae bacterium]